MKIEDQVCTLEQAKCLNKLGIIQDSVFYYTQDKTPVNPNMSLYGYAQNTIPVYVMFGKQSRISGHSVYSEYSAFTVAELGQMVPALINECELMPGKTEAECRAILLIDLLNAKIITAEEVNKRFTES